MSDEKKGLQSITDLERFQVVRSDFTNQGRRAPAITVKGNQVSFNMGCFHAMEDVQYVQFLIDMENQQLVVWPSKQYERDAIQWNRVNKAGKVVAKAITGKFFIAKLMELMGWKQVHRYRVKGVFQTLEGGQQILFFDLSQYETFVSEEPKVEYVEEKRILEDGTETTIQREVKRRVTKQYFPADWKDSFGIPFVEHQAGIQLDLARFRTVEVTPIRRGDTVRKVLSDAVDHVLDAINGKTGEDSQGSQMTIPGLGMTPVEG